MVIGRSVGSILTRRFPPSTLLFATMVVTAIGFPIFWLSTVGVFSVIGLFIAGIGVSNFFPLILSMATNTAPHQADTVSARISLGAGMAILLAPLILGTIADQITIQGAYGIVGVLLVSLLGISLYANRITSEKVISAG
jgi:fucose permease